MLKLNEDSYIISDTHLGHKNIIKHESSRNESKEYQIINSWNKTIKKDDTILHMGDFALSNIEKYAKKLNGKKTIIKGNHDKDKFITILKKYSWNIIDEVVINIEEDISHLKYNKHHLLCCYITDINGQRVMFSHFPVFNDNSYDEKYKEITDALEYLFLELECDINIHGHTHSKNAKEPFCINSCVEKTDFKPKKIKEILSKKIDFI